MPVSADRTSVMSAPDVLDREFLEIRAKILEVAASFDRLDRGDGTVEGDPRVSLFDQALKILLSEDADRAERVQRLFSREYDPDWRKNLGVPPR